MSLTVAIPKQAAHLKELNSEGFAKIVSKFGVLGIEEWEDVEYRFVRLELYDARVENCLAWAFHDLGLLSREGK